MQRGDVLTRLLVYTPSLTHPAGEFDQMIKKKKMKHKEEDGVRGS